MKFKKPLFWKNKNLLSMFLLPLSLVTLLFNHIKLILVEKKRFGIPIICVGNIYLGGTGKTPLSIFIYNVLKKKQYKPAIVRKYYSSHLDEINFTKSKVKKIFSDKKRTLAISNAEEDKNNVIIMDDGLQDVSIIKDLKIVCFNSSDLAGNGFLLPAGPLREQLSKVNDCRIAVINGKRNLSFEKKLKSISENIKIYQSKYEIKNLKKFRGKKILAFAGIGNPESFFKLLKNSGLKVIEEISFPDHYNYTKNEIEDMVSKAKEKDLTLITTEKDFFRIKQLGLRKMNYISVDLKIIDYKNFERELLKSI
tara:strand:+ start:4518 stop:5444 length:927 start_codon:yes stop_codon:yes gene_type:complete